MNGWGVAYGLIGTTTIAGCLYMVVHEYAWWQVICVALLGYALLPYYKEANK